jgi:NTP pyrophosphatase (non-canonical NTP hydrolase)
MMMDKLFRIAEGLNARFPDGNDPFMIVTRLAEECGEVAAEVNHFERKGVKVERHGAPDRRKLAKELQDVVRAVLHLALFYDLRDELEASVDQAYRRVVSEGLVEPLAGDHVERNCTHRSS